MQYINYFFIYSIFGHIIEKTLYPKEASGILYGWWTPIYGIGCLIIIGIFYLLSNKTKLKGLLKVISLFICSAFFLALIEYIGGMLIYKIFHFSFWDYSNMKYNIGKYTSLEMALIWGVSSILLIYIIHPIIVKLEKHIPKWITYILVLLFITDISFKFFPKIKK